MTLTPDQKARCAELKRQGYSADAAAKQIGAFRDLVRMEFKSLASPTKKQSPHTIKPSGDIKKIVFVTDSHDAPDIPQERFHWIGKYIAESNPDYFIHGGDFATFDSVSTHEQWGTISGNARAPMQAELDSFRRALDILLTPIEKADCKAKRVFVEGNHEDRVRRFENLHPQLSGMLTSQIENAFQDRDFATYAYRMWFMLDGVGFTHVPHNAMGKRYAENTLLNDAVFSIVYGDSHKPVFRTKPKAGFDKQIRIFNPGCSLPHGHVEPYCMNNTTGWGWSIGELYICDGDIIGQAMIPMLELERRYK